MERVKSVVVKTLKWLRTPEAQAAWILHLLDAESAGDPAKLQASVEQATEILSGHTAHDKEIRARIQEAVEKYGDQKARAAWILAGLIVLDPDHVSDLVARAVELIDKRVI